MFIGGIRGGRHPILLRVANLDPFQGLQPQVILASLVSEFPRMMSDILRAHKLSSTAHFELHLFGRFARWGEHPTPGAWIAALSAVQWEAGSGTVSTGLELGKVLREAGVIDRVSEGMIDGLEGSVVGRWPC